MKNYVIKSFGHYYYGKLNESTWEPCQTKATRMLKEDIDIMIKLIIDHEPYLEGFVKAVKLKPKKSTLLIKEILEQSKLFGYMTPDLIEKIEQYLKGNS